MAHDSTCNEWPTIYREYFQTMKFVFFNKSSILLSYLCLPDHQRLFKPVPKFVVMCVIWKQLKWLAACCQFSSLVGHQPWEWRQWRSVRLLLAARTACVWRQRLLNLLVFTLLLNEVGRETQLPPLASLLCCSFANETVHGPATERPDVLGFVCLGTMRVSYRFSRAAQKHTHTDNQSVSSESKWRSTHFSCKNHRLLRTQSCRSFGIHFRMRL